MLAKYFELSYDAAIVLSLLACFLAPQQVESLQPFFESVKFWLNLQLAGINL
jgi:hypothetical protein